MRSRNYEAKRKAGSMTAADFWWGFSHPASVDIPSRPSDAGPEPRSPRSASEAIGYAVEDFTESARDISKAWAREPNRLNMLMKIAAAADYLAELREMVEVKL